MLINTKILSGTVDQRALDKIELNEDWKKCKSPMLKVRYLNSYAIFLTHQG